VNFRRLSLQQLVLLCLLSSVSFGQKNICIDSTHEPEEVSLAINRNNPACIVAGANITNYYYSINAGSTWKHRTMKSIYGVWGDPCVLSDTAGDFYFVHLSTPKDGTWLDRMVCQKSTDSGKTWNDGSYAGLNGERNQDKPWGAVDFTNSKYRNRIYLSWTQFDKYESRKPNDSSRILFAYSDDAGKSWQNPIRLDEHGGDCLDGDNTVEGAVPCVGPEGQVYDAWGGPEGIMFVRSSDGGKTFSENVKVANLIGGWDYDISGIDRCNGMPITCCDVSQGKHRGTIYISWSDQRKGKDNTCIWLARSSDQGNTWSKPIKINDDKGYRQHFMTWLDVDPVTGYVYSLFYDRREHGGDTTDVYLAVSKDGGNSFINFRINEKSFVPTASDFFGDYINVKAYNNIVRPIWMQLNDHELRIFTALINPGDLDWALYTPGGPQAENNASEEAINNSSIWFKTELDNTEIVSLSVIDTKGHTVYTVFTNRTWKDGDHEYLLDVRKNKIPPGVYAYKFDEGLKSTYQPFLVY
jgi:hypothetical protein